MTIIIPAHRALTTKLAGRSYQVVTRYGYNPWLARVNQTPISSNDIKSNQSQPSSHRAGSIWTRTYATTTAKAPVGRPKAHTGRTPARKSTRAAAAKKPGPKTAAGKSKVGRKPKAKKKATAKKPVKKAVKRPLSKEALNRQRIAAERELKSKALLDSPKDLPASAWQVVLAEISKASTGQSGRIGLKSKEASAKYKSLTPEEIEHYNHIANQNKEQNDKAYKAWISSHTPEQIKDANTARRALRARYVAKHNAKNCLKFPPLQDDRLVKMPRTAFIDFCVERRASGDYARMHITESSKLLGREWKQLDAATKKIYDDRAKADHNRYVEEIKTVYGLDFKPTRKAKKAAA